MSIGLVIFRYFKVTGSERKQLRWLGFGMLTAFVFAAGPHFLVLGDNPDEWATFAASFGIVALDATLLTAIGIGILFYRLWDIDVIIRRTFTYSLVSVVLVGSYLLIVFATQAVLHTFIDSESSLAVVISTLGVAVLFNPVRTRVQQVIDRLFNRKHYDADATLEAFRDNIRDAIEPEAIQGHLVQTISSTVQPATISFWGIDRQ
jgi:hypothetical protein